MAQSRPLAGTRIAITSPAGTGGPLARRVRALGGTSLLLPGSSLRAAADADAARTALEVALAADVAIFTSPAAVRFARRLRALEGHAIVLAPGTGTLLALRRAGCRQATSPAREDSEGILALPTLREVRGRRVGIVGAPGGRGLLATELARRGASVVSAHVYQRAPARLDQRHALALGRSPHKPLYLLLSSAGALGNLLHGLPAPACRILLAGTATVSSERLEGAAHAAGFARVLNAGSAHTEDLLTAIVNDWRARRLER